MASIREYASANGKTTLKVLFRRGDKQTSKTFTVRKAAERSVTRTDLSGVEAALEWLNAQDKPRRAGTTLD